MNEAMLVRFVEVQHYAAQRRFQTVERQVRTNWRRRQFDPVPPRDAA